MSSTKRQFASGTAAATGMRMAALLSVALGIGAMLPQAASANPYYTPDIYPGECPKDGSPRVSCVQWVLQAYCGHPNLKVDGCFGPATQAAVKDLQRLFGLQENGIVDAHTGEGLDNVMLLKASEYDLNWWNTFCWDVVPTLDG